MKKSLIKVLAVLHGLGCYLGSTVSGNDDYDDDISPDDVSHSSLRSGRRQRSSSVFCGATKHRRRRRRRTLSYSNSTDVEEETDQGPSAAATSQRRENRFWSRAGSASPADSLKSRCRHRQRKSPFQKRCSARGSACRTAMPGLNSQGVMLISMRHETKIVTDGHKARAVYPRSVLRLNKPYCHGSTETIYSEYSSDEETRLEQTLGEFLEEGLSSLHAIVQPDA